MYTHGYCTIISSKMRFGGFAKTLGCRLLSTPHGITYPKLIIVVDEDVDPFDLQRVIWAMTVRFRPERDLVLIPNAPASTLDPAHLVRGLATKVIIDAAKPAFPDIPLADAAERRGAAGNAALDRGNSAENGAHAMICPRCD